MGLLDKWSKKQDKKTLDTVVKTEGSVKTTKSVGKTKETKKVVSSVRGSAYRVILKPLVSEKASAAEINGRYTFLVNAKNNKTEIKQAIKQIYGIVPIDVNVMNFEGKRTRSGTLLGKRTDYKKAIVTLAKGHTINIHEGV